MIKSITLSIVRGLGSLIFLLMLSFQTYAQNKITGKVTASDTQDGLPGTSVLIKGTSIGTQTDVSGNFSLDMDNENVTLVFSFVGYVSEEVAVAGRNVINIELHPNLSKLSEVVVMGYSEKSRKELTASVVTIKSKELTKVTSSDVGTMLQGRVAGLTVNNASGQPGERAQIRLRGITSVSVDRAPLFVVDGMIGGNFVPSDVASVTVLKDAAAIGLYGSLGAAGVIIVTTKTATSNETEFSFSANMGLKEISTGNFRMENGADLYEIQRTMWGDDVIGFLKNRPEELQDQNFDWLDAGFKSAMVKNYNFSVRGKSKHLAYGFNTDYYDEEGTFVNTDFKRLNIKLKAALNNVKKFSIGTDVNIQFTKDKSGFFSWFEDAYYSMPWDSPYDSNGKTKFVSSSEFDGKWYGQFRRNFLNSTGKNEVGSGGFDVAWSMRAKYELTNWLSIENRTRLTYNNARFSEFYSAHTSEGSAKNGIVNAFQQDGWGVLSTSFFRLSKSFGKHELGGFIAHEGSTNFFQTLGATTENLSPSIKVPDGSSVSTASGFNLRGKGISFIGEATYGYDGKYFGTLVYRIDGSSGFAPDVRYAKFPAASFAWLISNEAFMENSSAIDILKLRLSYGLVGNDGQSSSGGPGALAYLPTYKLNRQYNGQPAGDPDNPENSKLGWETSTIANLGLDISLFKGDLELNVDVYQKSVDQMLFFNPLALSQGYEAKWENIGAMRNRGIEVVLNYHKKFGAFNYAANFNISRNSNEITHITDITDEQFLASNSVRQINKVGLPAFMWYMPKWLGVDPATGGPIWEKLTYDTDGNIIDRTPTSIYDEATFQPNESAIPTISGGFSNSLSFKGFTFSFLLTYQMGNYIYHRTREFIDSDGANTGINFMKLQDGWSRWQKPGDIATHPIVTRGDTDGSHFTSTRYMEKGDYLRVRNISLSYNLPKSVLDWAGFSGATISFGVDNLTTFTAFSGLDPDVNMTAGAFELPGLSDLKYPISKQYKVGINVNF